MARYQLIGTGWPTNGGALVVPVGTILDSTKWTFLGTPLPSALPLNAIPLDQDAFDEMLRQYPDQKERIITTDPNINRG